MANEEHLAKLLEGVEVWNRWRKENPDARPDLSEANLRGIDFRETVYFADLRGTDLRSADLAGVNLSNGRLRGADLTEVDFTGADLTEADLISADLTSAKITAADFRHALLGVTSLCGLDLSQTRRLDSVHHALPSHISTSTFEASHGKIPAAFLRGCGLSDWEIETVKLWNRKLGEQERTAILYEISRLQGESPIRVNPLFISYSHADTAFVLSLETRLDQERIRYWRDVHEMKAGRMETQIDRALRLHPTVLLVLSAESIESDWVVWEVKKARELEQQLERDVLCPLALDDAWKMARWPERLRYQVEEYSIVDFSQWREPGGMDNAFQKLLDGLNLYYTAALTSPRPEETA